MKNLEVSRTLKTLLLSGAIFVLSGCSINEDAINNKGFLFDQTKYLNKTYSLFLKENNLVPVKINSESSFSNVLRGEFIEKKMAEAYIDENGELKFNEYWEFLTEDERDSFMGIGRISNEAYFEVYEVKEKNGKFVQEKVEGQSLDINKNYYVDLDDDLILKDPVEYTFRNGKTIKKVR